jgi:hypothetical protein
MGVRETVLWRFLVHHLSMASPDTNISNKCINIGKSSFLAIHQEPIYFCSLCKEAFIATISTILHHGNKYLTQDSRLKTGGYKSPFLASLEPPKLVDSTHIPRPFTFSPAWRVCLWLEWSGTTHHREGPGWWGHGCLLVGFHPSQWWILGKIN